MGEGCGLRSSVCDLVVHRWGFLYVEGILNDVAIVVLVACTEEVVRVIFIVAGSWLDSIKGIIT